MNSEPTQAPASKGGPAPFPSALAVIKQELAWGEAEGGRGSEGRIGFLVLVFNSSVHKATGHPGM